MAAARARSSSVAKPSCAPSLQMATEQQQQQEQPQTRPIAVLVWGETTCPNKSMVMDYVLENGWFHMDLTEVTKKDPSTRVSHLENGTFANTQTAIYSQEAWADVMTTVLDEVWNHNVLSLMCNKGLHRSDVTGRTTCGLLNTIFHLDGTRMFNAQVFSLAGVDKRDLRNTLENVSLWGRVPWAVLPTPTCNFGEEAAMTNPNAAENYTKVKGIMECWFAEAAEAPALKRQRLGDEDAAASAVPAASANDDMTDDDCKGRPSDCKPDDGAVDKLAGGKGRSSHGKAPDVADDEFPGGGKGHGKGTDVADDEFAGGGKGYWSHGKGMTDVADEEFPEGGNKGHWSHGKGKDVACDEFAGGGKGHWSAGGWSEGWSDNEKGGKAGHCKNDYHPIYDREASASSTTRYNFVPPPRPPPRTAVAESRYEIPPWATFESNPVSWYTFLKDHTVDDNAIAEIFLVAQLSEAGWWAANAILAKLAKKAADGEVVQNSSGFVHRCVHNARAQLPHGWGP